MLLAADSGSLETLAAESCQRDSLPLVLRLLLLKRVWQLGTASEHTRTPSVAAQPPCHVTKATQAQQRRELKVFLAAGSFFARLSLCSV